MAVPGDGGQSVAYVLLLFMGGSRARAMMMVSDDGDDEASMGGEDDGLMDRSEGMESESCLPDAGCW